MIPSPQVVAVDDRPNELTSIISALRKLDVACLPILVTGGLNPDIEKPFEGVRLVFFDINYLSGPATTTTIFETAMAVMERILSKTNGPYVLITWSSKSDDHDELMRQMAENDRLPVPSVTGYLAKEKFITAGVSSEAQVKQLSVEISEIVRKHPYIEALLRWETSARLAAGDVVGSILNLCSSKDRFCSTCGDQLSDLLAHIAAKSVGVSNVEDDRRRAMMEAMAPILYDRLIHRAVDEAESDSWKRSWPAGHVPKSPAEAISAKLNTLTNVAVSRSGVMRPGDRGVVVEVDQTFVQHLAEVCGTSVEEISGQFASSKKKNDNNITLPDIAEISAKCRWLLIGFRAVCDQSQNSSPMLPVALGMEFPGDIKEKGDGLRRQGQGPLWTSPPFDVENEIKRIVVSLKWTFSLPASELAEKKSIYRFREAMINLLAIEIGNHSTRPGILMFH